MTEQLGKLGKESLFVAQFLFGSLEAESDVSVAKLEEGISAPYLLVEVNENGFYNSFCGATEGLGWQEGANIATAAHSDF